MYTEKQTGNAYHETKSIGVRRDGTEYDFGEFAKSYTVKPYVSKDSEKNHMESTDISRSVLQDKNKPWYNEDKTERNNNMSLVGIMKNRNGIVAFGDEKSSYMIGTSTFSKGFVKKVFKGGNFLFVTSGSNEVRISNGTILLENVIEEVVPADYDSYEIFFEKLQEKLFAIHQYEVGEEFYFLVGSPYIYSYQGKEYHDYKIVECIISQNDVKYICSYHDAIRCNGITDFLPRNLFVKEDWTLKDMEDYASHLVDHSIYYCRKKSGDNAPIDGQAQILSIF